MSRGIYNSIDGLLAELRRCNDCCSGNYQSYHCPLCPPTLYKPKDIGKVKQHISKHWNKGIEGRRGLRSVICHLQHDGVDGRHYHCSMCDKIIIRNRKTFERHVRRHIAEEEPSEQYSVENESEETAAEDNTEKYIIEDQEDEEETEVFIQLGVDKYRSCLRKNPPKHIAEEEPSEQYSVENESEETAAEDNTEKYIIEDQEDEEETEVFIQLGVDKYRSCLRKNPPKKRRSSFWYPA